MLTVYRCFALTRPRPIVSASAIVGGGGVGRGRQGWLVAVVMPVVRAPGLVADSVVSQRPPLAAAATLPGEDDLGGIALGTEVQSAGFRRREVAFSRAAPGLAVPVPHSTGFQKDGLVIQVSPHTQALPCLHTDQGLGVGAPLPLLGGRARPTLLQGQAILQGLQTPSQLLVPDAKPHCLWEKTAM